MTIYFDHNATTPLHPDARAAWQQLVQLGLANPASVHRRGAEAAHHLEEARRSLAENLGCASDELVFTSGASEGANQVLRTLLRPSGDAAQPVHAVVSAIEHHAVLEPAQALAKQGVAVDFVLPDSAGRIAPDAVNALLRANTVLVAVMAANNETGVIQDIPAITATVAQFNQASHANVGLFCDATQAVGKLPAAHFAAADWVCFSGHKFGAPKGVGGLICRRELPALLLGGNAEHGRRAGTVPVELAGAMAAALKAHTHALTTESAQVAALRDRLERGILAAVPGSVIAGGAAGRISNTTFVCFPGLRAETLVMNFDLAGLCTSTGAACVQGAAQTSHVLAAMRLPADQIAGAVRFSLGVENTQAEVDQAVEIVKAVCARLQQAPR